VPALLADSTAAGVPITVETLGRPRRLPAVVEHACYRIVQETLTNVRKHAGTPPTHLRFEHGVDQLRISIVNGPPVRPAPSPFPPGGHGLAGLRERARLVGGHLVAGPTQQGGFEVSATIPLPPEEGPAAVIS
jgi:signal transduction histidine kinase